MLEASEKIVKIIKKYPTPSKKEAGADDFLAKPFEMNELLAKIKMYV